VEVVQADAKRLPFGSGSVDRVFMLDIVEHLHRWELLEAYAEVRRVLRSGGYAVIHTTPNRWAVDYGYRLARLAFRRLPENPPLARDTFHVNEQSVASLHRDLAAAGFASRVWLDDVIMRHSDWRHETKIDRAEARDAVYAILGRPAVRRAYRLAAATPLRFVLLNDIFALAWPRDGDLPADLSTVPPGRLEAVVGWTARRIGGR
jgi:SAM-dependent methyltransferase